jgi:hypothetical protein
VGYVLTTFDSLAIPAPLGQSGSIPLDSGAALSPIVSLPGGHIWDAWGASQSPRPSVVLTANAILTAASASALQTALNAWYAKVGIRGSLVRTGGDATTHSVTARLLGVKASRGRQHRLHLPIGLDFEVLGLPWKGAVRNVVGNIVAGTVNLACVNSGNAQWSSPVVTVTAGGGGSITSAEIISAPMDGYVYRWTWTGTLAATKALLIDCAVMSVKNDGADAYAGFALHTTHNLDGWLAIPAGGATVTCNATGAGAAGATARVVSYDGWA